MRRLTLVILTILLTASLFVACRVEINEPDDNTVTLQFRTDDSDRSLTSSRTALSSTSYVWYYEAEKSDATNGSNPTPATGTTSEITKVGTDGTLSSSVGPFSLGKWNFTLYAYKKSTTTPTEANLVFKGTVSSYLLEADTKTINVAVEPQKVTGGTGKITVSKSIKLTAEGTQYEATDVEIAGVDVTLDDTVTTLQSFNTSSRKDLTFSSLPVGSYRVIVSCKKDEGTTFVTYARNTIYVNVWNTLTTTVSGALDEITVEANFVSDENEDGSIVESADVENNSEAVYSFNYSPLSNEYSGSSNKLGTTVKGTFAANGTTGDPTLVVTTYPATSKNINSKFTVAEGDEGHPVAGVDIELKNAVFVTETVDGTAVNKTAIITTYIIKGLTSPKMYHNGNTEVGKTMEDTAEENESDVDTNGEWWYDPGTGKLVFATNSFSSFYVSSKDVSLNSTTNTAYATLQEAMDEAVSDDIITLLCDVADGGAIESPDSSTKFVSKANLTIDFNGYTYTVTKDPVGSSSTQNQAMHLSSTYLKKITLKNGTFKVAENVEELNCAIQNYIDFNAEGMTFDLSEVPLTYYDKNNQTYIDYGVAGIEKFVICNNSSADKTVNGKMTLKDSCVILNKDSKKGIVQDSSNLLTLTNTQVAGYVSINGEDCQVKVDSKSSISGGSVLPYISEGYMVESSVSRGITTYTLKAIEAVNSSTGVSYSSFSSAVSKASSGDTIAMYKDITSSSELKIANKTLTINMNGKTYTGNYSNGVAIRVTGKSDVTFTGKGTLVYEGANYGAIAIGNTSSGNAKFGSVTIYEGTKVTIGEDVTVKGLTAVYVEEPNANVGYNNVTVNFYGKAETSGYAFHIQGNNTSTEKFPTFNLKGATVNTTSSTGIYAAGYGKWNIEDTTINGVDSAVELRAGELTVTSGTLAATSTAFTSSSNGGGVSSSGAAVIVSPHTTTASNKAISPVVKINGGSYSGLYAIAVLNPESTNSSTAVTDCSSVSVVFNATKEISMTGTATTAPSDTASGSVYSAGLVLDGAVLYDAGFYSVEKSVGDTSVVTAVKGSSVQ